jgi:hypothetical protein
MLKGGSYFVIKKNHFYTLYPYKLKIILLIFFITINKHKVLISLYVKITIFFKSVTNKF